MGDPFTEKLLLEASLELIESGAISGIQDMGAAGLTSSASEMAGRAGNGVEIDTALVPVREAGMTPYEILLSESQERMLVVAKRAGRTRSRRILEKWELEAAVIGRVTDDGLFRVLEDGHVVAEIPALPLTEGCPTYEREGVESRGGEAASARRTHRAEATPAPGDAGRRPAPAPGLAQPSPRSGGSTASTTPPCAPTPWSGPAATPAWCASGARAWAWRPPPTATAATST